MAMRTEAAEHSPISTFKEIDILVQPDVGGRYEPNFSFDNTIVIAQPTERITAPTEAPKSQKESRLDIEEYLIRVARLQSFFDSRLGIRERGVIRNYNPVLERAAFEQLQTEEEREQFKLYEIKQIETALRERYHVATSIVIYDIDDDGKLRSRDLPNQAFEDVLTIGIEYYKQLGSPDVSRMEQERIGILKIQEAFADPNAQISLKAGVVSGPGLVKDTIFKDNFRDRYELLEDPFTQRRIVQMTRFASDLSYEQAEEIITASRPDYFDGVDIPIDQWLLANPIIGGNSEILIPIKNALKEEEFQKITQEGTARMQFLVSAICDSIFSPEKVAITLNAVLNGADYMWKRITGIKDRILSSVSAVTHKLMPVFRSLWEEINWLGHQAVRAVAVGCGLSGGFSIGGGFSLGNVLSVTAGFILGIINRFSGIFGGENGKKGKSCLSCGEVNYCTEDCYKCGGMLI
ncbi:hypothetical protein HYT18_01335 [Candidatus Microgenomates bacterium]|nr:hypothetical protein [Candidatus Microgenomates bacterium]